MNREELSVEAYVVLGNALNLLLHGVAAGDQARLALAFAELQRLNTWFSPLRPHEIADAVGHLPDHERALLAEALVLCERLSAERAEDLLGAPSEVRRQIYLMLCDSRHQAGDRP